MSASLELSSYVRDALRRGQTPDAVRTALDAAGWTAPEIDAALSGWLVQDGVGVVPRPVRTTSARDAVFYALLFVVFGMVVGNVLTLLFGQINFWLPEPGDRFQARGASGLRWSMAALIVFVPAFWLLNRSDTRARGTDPSRKHGAIRRWLSSLAILIAVITLMGDALFLIYTWLDGQMTLRFVTKSATVAAMAGIVFLYFREDRHQTRGALGGLAAWVLIGLSVAALALSFWVIGGPSTGRSEYRDQVRITDLRDLSRDVANCAEISAPPLPDTLNPMICASNPARLSGYAADITYQRIDDRTFDLCISVEFPGAVQDYGLRIDGDTVCIRSTYDR